MSHSGQPRAAFAAAHPGLFKATGCAHHPYDFSYPPGHQRADPDIRATLANLATARVGARSHLRAYGPRRRRASRSTSTEWGCKSQSPQPVRPVQPGPAGGVHQPGRIHGVDAIPRVRVASPSSCSTMPAPTRCTRSEAAPTGRTFQTGLDLQYQRVSPSRPTPPIELPIWLPHPRHGKTSPYGPRSGQKSPGVRTGELAVQAHGVPRPGPTWPRSRSSNPEGFITTHVVAAVGG